jgi:transposase InsO family protein
MIHLKLRQAGQLVNYKRVERLYRLEKLQIRRRRRKKIPVAERQPLIRPGAANEVWSMDFVFDRVATGRTIKSLVIVDDATHECVAIVAEHSIGGTHLTRILDEVCAKRGKPADSTFKGPPDGDEPRSPTAQRLDGCRCSPSQRARSAREPG